jgi:hypothetical protein
MLAWVCLLASPATGFAVARAPELWATVNLCDTERAPDSMGVRAGMPGNGTSQRMYMRFKAQYWSVRRQDWTAVGGTAVSPWVFAGSARHPRGQAGWTFEFSPPPPGVTFRMRALVEFRWGSKHLRTLTRTTRSGIRGAEGGDPAGTSKAVCLIS